MTFGPFFPILCVGDITRVIKEATMIVKSLEHPVYYKKKRQPLPGKGMDRNEKPQVQKTFDQYLMESFQGEVVQKGKDFSSDLSSLTKENLIRLSNM